MNIITSLAQESFLKGFEEGYKEGYKEGFKRGFEEGMKKGKYKVEVIAIRNMTQYKIEISMMAFILDITIENIQEIQQELEKEVEIIIALDKKQTLVRIAKRLKVSEWLVEVLQELQKSGYKREKVQIQASSSS